MLVRPGWSRALRLYPRKTLQRVKLQLCFLCIWRLRMSSASVVRNSVVCNAALTTCEKAGGEEQGRVMSCSLLVCLTMSRVIKPGEGGRINAKTKRPADETGILETPPTVLTLSLLNFPFQTLAPGHKCCAISLCPRFSARIFASLTPPAQSLKPSTGIRCLVKSLS